MVPESQRDSVSKPRVARDELPWVTVPSSIQPQRGCGPLGDNISRVRPWVGAAAERRQDGVWHPSGMLEIFWNGFRRGRRPLLARHGVGLGQPGSGPGSIPRPSRNAIRILSAGASPPQAPESTHSQPQKDVSGRLGHRGHHDQECDQGITAERSTQQRVRTLN